MKFMREICIVLILVMAIVWLGNTIAQGCDLRHDFAIGMLLFLVAERIDV